MRMKLLLSAGLVACGLGLATTSVQAAPAGGLAAAVDLDAARTSPVENVTYGWYGRRHCHWHYGYRHCWHGHRYGYGYGRWHKHGWYGYGRPYRHQYGYGYGGYRRGWY